MFNMNEISLMPYSEYSIGPNLISTAGKTIHAADPADHSPDFHSVDSYKRQLQYDNIYQNPVAENDSSQQPMDIHIIQ